MEDEKPVTNCYNLVNMDDYENYYFFLSNEKLLQSTTVLNHNESNECNSFYYHSTAFFEAMEKNEFEKILTDNDYQVYEGTIIENLHGEEPSLYNFEHIESFGTDFKEYFIPSSLEIEYGTAVVKLSNPLAKIDYNYQIKNLTKDNLDIELAQVVYTYEDGTTEVNNIVNDVVPEPEKKVYTWIYYTAAGLGLLVILIVGLVFLIKKKNK